MLLKIRTMRPKTGHRTNAITSTVRCLPSSKDSLRAVSVLCIQLVTGLAFGAGMAGPPVAQAQEEKKDTAAPEFVVLYRYAKSDPVGTFKYTLYDTRKGQYKQPEAQAWLDKINAPGSSFEGRSWELRLSEWPGDNEQAKVGAATTSLRDQLRLQGTQWVKLFQQEGRATNLLWTFDMGGKWRQQIAGLSEEPQEGTWSIKGNKVVVDRGAGAMSLIGGGESSPVHGNPQRQLDEIEGRWSNDTLTDHIEYFARIK